MEKRADGPERKLIESMIGGNEMQTDRRESLEAADVKGRKRSYPDNMSLGGPRPVLQGGRRA